MQCSIFGTFLSDEPYGEIPMLVGNNWGKYNGEVLEFCGIYIICKKKQLLLMRCKSHLGVGRITS